MRSCPVIGTRVSVNNRINPSPASIRLSDPSRTRATQQVAWHESLPSPASRTCSPQCPLRRSLIPRPLTLSKHPRRTPTAADSRYSSLLSRYCMGRSPPTRSIARAIILDPSPSAKRGQEPFPTNNLGWPGSTTPESRAQRRNGVRRNGVRSPSQPNSRDSPENTLCFPRFDPHLPNRNGPDHQPSVPHNPPLRSPSPTGRGPG